MPKNIFLSYNWQSGDIFADRIEKRLKSLGIGVTRDIHATRAGDSLSQFMQTLQNHDYVVCIISDEYLKSMACMLEQIYITEVAQNNGKDRFILPIIVSGTRIFSPEERGALRKYWADRKENIPVSSFDRTSPNPDIQLAEQIAGSTETIIERIFSSIENIGDLLALTEKLLDENEEQFFRNFFQVINEPFPDVYRLLLEAEMIPDREQRMIQFDKLKSQYQDELLVPLFEAYLLVHDIQEYGTPDHTRAEQRFLEAIKIKPDFSEALNNFASLYIDYPEKFPDAYQKALDLGKKAVASAQTVFHRACCKGNLALIYRRLWGIEKKEDSLQEANRLYKEAIQDIPGVVKLRLDYYAFLSDNLYRHPDLADIDEFHSHLDAALALDPGYLLSECQREIALETDEKPNLFCRKIAAMAAGKVRDWPEVKKYNDEILAFTGKIVPDGSDNAHDWDCYRAVALSGKAQAVMEMEKGSQDEIELAKNLWDEAIPLFEKRGEIAAALGAKINLAQLILEYSHSSDDIGGLTEKISEIEKTAREAGLREQEAECWHLRSDLALRLGKPPAEWLFCLEKSLSVLPDNALKKRARQASQIGAGYFSLASSHHAELFEKAKCYYEQALKIEERRMDSWWIAHELWNVGKTCEQLGKAKNSLLDYNQAEHCFNQAIDLLQAVGDQETLAKCLHSRIILLKNVFCYKKEQGNFDCSIIAEIQKAFKELHDLNVGVGRETEGIHNTKAQFYHALDKFPEMLEEINAHVEYYRNEFDRKGVSTLHKLAWARQTRQWLVRNSPLDADPALGTLAQEDRDFYIRSMRQLGRPYS